MTSFCVEKATLKSFFFFRLDTSRFEPEAGAYCQHYHRCSRLHSELRWKQRRKSAKRSDKINLETLIFQFCFCLSLIHSFPPIAMIFLSQKRSFFAFLASFFNAERLSEPEQCWCCCWEVNRARRKGSLHNKSSHLINIVHIPCKRKLSLILLCTCWFCCAHN